MNCPPVELKDYLFHELAGPDRLQFEMHIKTCSTCREELDRLRHTEAALFSLREEEIPQRIGFVSDPVFEPSGWRRWWSVLWGSPPRLGFAAAAMLSAAIVFSAVTRPPLASRPVSLAAVTPAARIAPVVSDAEIDRRVQAAVVRAVDQNQQRQMAGVRQLVGELEQARQQLKLAAAEWDMSQRRADNVRVLSSNYGPPQRSVAGEEK